MCIINTPIDQQTYHKSLLLLPSFRSGLALLITSSLAGGVISSDSPLRTSPRLNATTNKNKIGLLFIVLCGDKVDDCNCNYILIRVILFNTGEAFNKVVTSVYLHSNCSTEFAKLMADLIGLISR